MKVATITCYRHTSYVRGTTLRQAVADQADTQQIIIQNKHKGLLRYPEVMCKIIWTRLRHRPNVYLLTFRAYEILPAAVLLTWPKKLIYDEFLNPLEWLQEERTERWAKLIPQGLLQGFYKLLLRRCSLVLTDTDAHASFSSNMLELPANLFFPLPVGTDEKLFKPSANTPKTKEFSVLYYGSMLPLHGIHVVLEAAHSLRGQPIKFIIAGGDSATAKVMAEIVASGAQIEHRPWIPFEQLAHTIQQSHLVLCGPFGDTPQARMVITGKSYQALACAVPILIGKTEVDYGFVDRKNCLITPLADASTLANQIMWAYEHPKELTQIGSSGQKLYTEKFSAVALASEMTKILHV